MILKKLVLWSGILLVTLSSYSQVTTADSLALVDLYNNCNGTNWSVSTNWLTANPVNSWYGVTVTNGHVTSLFLSNNQLSGTLPASMEDLDSLQSLTLSVNSITAFPSTIGNMTALKYLDMGTNSLGSIPSNIGSLNKLETLDLRSNGISSLPLEIGNLISLNILLLHSNTLTSLPDTLGNLVNLKILSLCHNNLSSLPTSIDNLNQLTTLDVANNNITFLPASVGNLGSLTTLVVDYNLLDTIPSSIGNINTLTSLHLYENQLTRLPSSIVNLTNLTDLRLHGNLLDSLPTSLGNLVNLTYLTIFNNALISLPVSIGNLVNITELNANNNNLSTLPSSVGNLALTKLRLDNNPLDSLPNSVSDISGLQTLSLVNTNLSALPDSLGKLDTLLILDATGSKLTSLPGSISKINTFTSLLFDHNKLQSLPNFSDSLSKGVLSVTYNNLTFYDILPAIGHLDSLSYSPQANVGDSIDSVVVIYASHALYTDSFGGMRFEWYRDNGSVSMIGTNPNHVISIFNELDTGVYYCEIKHDSTPALTLITNPIHLSLQDTSTSFLENLNLADNLSFNIYPNPAKDEFVIIFESNKSEINVELSVYDPLGRKIFAETNFQIIHGNNIQKVNLKGQLSGTYLIEIKSNDKESLSKRLQVY